jgi:flagellar biosynthesis GTPase FlhF
MLPRTNFKVLTVLMSHLQFVVQHKATNKMDSTNLAIVFGPILCGSRNEHVGIIITDVSHVIRLISILIQEADFFFPDRQVEIAEKPTSPPSPSTATKEKPKKEKEKKEKKKEKEKEEEQKGKDRETDKKKRATNIKKINEEWTKRAEETATVIAPPSPATKKSKKEKKLEHQERKERKAKQKRINERWQRMAAVSPLLGRSGAGSGIGGGTRGAQTKERLEGLYSLRSLRVVQQITVNEFMQERASRIKSGKYTYEELQDWIKALEG